MKENLVITISRQYGAGGRELAGILAEKLGIKLYDRQLVHLAAAKLGIHDLSEDELLEMENTVKPLSMSFIPFHSFGTHMGESSQGMFMSESAVIRKIAEDGSSAAALTTHCATTTTTSTSLSAQMMSTVRSAARRFMKARASKNSTARTRSAPATTTTTRAARGATARTTTSSSTRARALRSKRLPTASSLISTRSKHNLSSLGIH